MNKIKDTKIGKFLAEKVPHVLDLVGDVLPEQGTLGIVKNIISKDPDLTPEEKQEIHNRLVEFYKLEVEDRDSARQREVEMVKAGSDDWMMNFTGVVGLGGFVLLLIAIVFIEVPVHNKELMIHTTGIVEGIVLSIVGYYFGSIAKKGR
jgi:hypothetical protein|tara:strand:+ start:84 stop:530 length:447 start_codon:yes stop_codon:yes gene_type:complete